MSHRLPLLFVTAAVCLGLAACGGDDDPPARAEATTQAAPPSGDDAPGTEAPRAGGGAATTDAAPATPRGQEENADAETGSSGGKRAAEEAKVRDALLTLQEATAARDGKKACSVTIGIPKKSDPKKPGLSCEAIGQGPKMTLSEANRRAVATARVTIDGNNAVASLGAMPMKLRKIDGRWRVDYTALTAPNGNSR